LRPSAVKILRIQDCFHKFPNLDLHLVLELFLLGTVTAL
jgi:hypothetical protein